MIELQKIDCNCNDCKFQVRNTERFKESLEQHKQWQLDYFNTLKNNLLKTADKWEKRGEPGKAETVRRQASRMKFQFDKKEASINYGFCEKKEKGISWIPNILQLDTQDCFKHRRES